MPDGVDWQIHRIATSAHYKSSLLEIETEWCLDDLMDATLVCDMYAKLEHSAAKEYNKR